MSETLIKQMDMAWTNIQHNERLRNNLFSTYLVVAGLFFALLRSGSEDDGNFKNVILIAGILVWCVGVLFLWALVRFREMIARDSKFVRRIIEILHEEEQGEHWELHLSYYERRDSAGILRLGSVSTCLATCSSVVAGLILTVGIWWKAQFDSVFLIVVFGCVLVANTLLHLQFRRLWSGGTAVAKVADNDAEVTVATID